MSFDSSRHILPSRLVITLPSEKAGAQGVELFVDEAVLAVFNVSDGWVLVCETSVRHVDAAGNTERVELGSVITSWTWSNRWELVIHADDGIDVRLRLRGTDSTRTVSPA